VSILTGGIDVTQVLSMTPSAALRWHTSRPDHKPDSDLDLAVALSALQIHALASRVAHVSATESGHRLGLLAMQRKLVDLGHEVKTAREAVCGEG
jgi:hypothetical protein